MTLAELSNGKKGIIIKVRGRGAFRKRIMEMGFIRGKEIEVIKNAPLRDPIEYKIMGYNISLRRSEAAMIDVLTPDEIKLSGHPHKKWQQHHLPPTMHTENTKTDHMAGAPESHEQHEKMFHRKISQTVPKERKGFMYHRHAMFPEHGAPGTDSKALRGHHGRRKFFHRHVSADILKSTAEKEGKIINIALVGNPNCGKTTLFNYASGSNERVGNYGGVTVDAKTSSFSQDGYTFNIVDLPGTYSITAYTHEELFVRDYIFHNTPDVVINVIDATNLERNLYLTTQLIDMDIKVVAALNMFDELQNTDDNFNYSKLGKMIGIPFVPTVSSKGKGLQELFKKAIDVYEDQDDSVRHIHINYGPSIENAINAIQKKIKIEANYPVTDIVSSRFLAIKLLEKDSASEERIFRHAHNSIDIFAETSFQVKKLEKEFKDDSESLITDAKYAFVDGALMETLVQAEKPKKTLSEKIDNIITHKLLGFPIFLFFMWLTFQLTFALGQFPMDWIGSFIESVSSFISATMPEGLLKDLIIDGAIAGMGGVIVFLPNILILFFMISFMEDTGYMARASFIMDKLMHRIGLHGKSFIPLIMGFGCNVPAIMATRTLESKNDRLLTMLILPFMSCSARLPVYVLFISAFFEKSAGSMLFLIYSIGVSVAIITAKIMKKTIFTTYEIPFVMELPPYRIPRFQTTLTHMWDKGKEYLKKIAGVVLIASIIIWALGKFPLNINYGVDFQGQISKYQSTVDKISGSTPLKTKLEEKILTLKTDMRAKQLEKSYIGRLGHLFEPVIQPLGFDWKMGVSLISGFAAKEIVVGTMGVLYHAEDDSEDTRTLVNNIKKQEYKSGPKKGEKVFSPLIAFGFMIFVLIYFPCMAVVAAIRRESGSWKWAAFALTYTTGVAWLLSFLIYRIGSWIL